MKTEKNNIENQVREKLNSREIQPSAQAWDRLDAMLSVAEGKKTKRSFGWLYIAASILVFATLGTFFYNQQNGKSIPNEVVHQDSVTKPDTTNSNNVPNTIEDTTTPAALTQVAENGKEKYQPASTEKVIRQNQKSNSNSNPIQNKINQKPTVNVNYNQSHEQVAVNTPKKEDPKLRGEQLNQNNISPKVIANNPDVAIASNETTSSASKVKVNANSLLSEVDGELELSFREKVLKKVTKNYKEVKVAIANRNLQ